ncbi:hypothetical protein ACKZDW_10360 [Ralstonia syzygii subsp. celebesensis]
MLAFSVKHNIADVQRTLSKAAKQQLPFAIAKGLTQTAKVTQDKLTSALPRQLDKPTPFTMRAFGVTAATKQRQLATVFIKPDQWKYLKYQVEGGVRRPAKRAVIVPESMRLNQYGNMPKGLCGSCWPRPACSVEPSTASPASGNARAAGRCCW